MGKSMERYHWIDVVKGLAIFLVVVGHVGGIYGGESASWSFNVIHTFIYSFHMPLFMFVSGYLFTSSLNKDYKTTALSKLISYGVPYIVFSIVYWAMKAVGGAFVNNTVSIRDLFLIPLFPLSFMWYIYALLIMVELTLLIGRRDKRVVLAVAVVCRIVWEVLTTAKGFTESWTNDLIVTDFINNYIWFALGMVYGGELMTRLKGMRTSDIFYLSSWIYHLVNCYCYWSCQDSISAYSLGSNWDFVDNCCRNGYRQERISRIHGSEYHADISNPWDCNFHFKDCLCKNENPRYGRLFSIGLRYGYCYCIIITYLYGV